MTSFSIIHQALPSPPPHRPSDHSRSSLSSSSSPVGNGQQRSRSFGSLGEAISFHRWASSRSTLRVESEGGLWEAAERVISLSPCRKTTARGRWVGQVLVRKGRTGRGGFSVALAARMAPELPTSEAVGTAAGENGEERGTRRLGAVFFDMDDTLVLTHEADSQAHLAVMELVGARAPQVDRSAVVLGFVRGLDSRPWDPEHKVEVSEWRARLWATALEEEGLEDMDLARDLQACFDRERLAGFRWTTGVEELVKHLHRQGIKVGIITNGHAKVQRAKLKACNAEELFDTILVGGEEPNMKPHRDIFIKACNLAGCKPEESIMVGDAVKTDIQGGINAGFLSTVWVNVHKSEGRHSSAKPDHEIATFVDLQHVLEQYGVVFQASE